MYYTYVIINPKGVLYKGSTDNLEKRISQHNGNTIFPGFTSNRGPWKLVYFERFQTREEARVREFFFKTGKGRNFLRTVIK